MQQTRPAHRPPWLGPLYYCGPRLTRPGSVSIWSLWLARESKLANGKGGSQDRSQYNIHGAMYTPKCGLPLVTTEHQSETYPDSSFGLFIPPHKLELIRISQKPNDAAAEPHQLAYPRPFALLARSPRLQCLCQPRATGNLLPVQLEEDSHPGLDQLVVPLPP